MTTMVMVRLGLAQRTKRCWHCFKFVHTGDQQVVVSDERGILTYHPLCAKTAGYSTRDDIDSLMANAEVAARALDKSQAAVIPASTDYAARAVALASTERNERAVPRASTETEARAEDAESTTRAARAETDASTTTPARPDVHETQEEPMSVQSPTPMTNKARLMAVMRERAIDRPHKGWVSMNVPELAEVVSKRYGVNVNDHEVTHMLHDLHGYGLVDFSTSKKGRGEKGNPIGDIPIRIRVTKRGLDVMAEPAHDTTEAFPDDLAELTPEQALADGRARGVRVVEVEATRIVPNGAVLDLREGPAKQDVVFIDLPMEYPDLYGMLTAEEKLGTAAMLLREAGKTGLAELVEEESVVGGDPIRKAALALVKELLASRGPVLVQR